MFGGKGDNFCDLYAGMYRGDKCVCACMSFGVCWFVIKGLTKVSTDFFLGGGERDRG